MGMNISNREILPLLIIEENSINIDGEKWFISRTELARQIKKFQKMHEDLVLKVISPDKPYLFSIDASIPTSEQLLSDLNDLVSRKLIEDREESLTKRGVIWYHKFKASPEGKEIIAKMITSLEERGIREKKLKKVLRQVQLPPKDHANGLRELIHVP